MLGTVTDFGAGASGGRQLRGGWKTRTLEDVPQERRRQWLRSLAVAFLY